MSVNKISMVNLTITSEGIGDKEKVSIQLSMPPFTSLKQMTAKDGGNAGSVWNSEQLTEAQKLGFEFLNWFQEKAEKRGGVIHRKFEAIKPN